MKELAYSDIEICILFDEAKNKGEQIQILADLNLVDKSVIVEILERNGRDLSDPEIKLVLENKTKRSRDVIYQRYKDLIDRGYSISEISEILEVKYSSAREYLWKHGLKPLQKKTAP